MASPVVHQLGGLAGNCGCEGGDCGVEVEEADVRRLRASIHYPDYLGGRTFGGFLIG